MYTEVEAGSAKDGRIIGILRTPDNIRPYYAGFLRSTNHGLAPVPESNNKSFYYRDLAVAKESVRIILEHANVGWK